MESDNYRPWTSATPEAVQRCSRWAVGTAHGVGRRARPPPQSAGSDRRRASRAAMVNTSCAVFRCGSTSHRHKGVKFHQFPRDERCPMWIEACKRKDLKGKDAEQLRNMHICSLHFEQRMYGKQLLKKSAVPTLNLPVTLTSDISTQTENYNYAPLQVCTSQGVQTEDEVFYVVTGSETAAEIPSNQHCYQNDQGNYYAKDNNQAQLNVVEDNSNFITIEQFLMGCDAFLPDGLNALIKSHITLSIEYNDSNLLS
ncbi:uncharacterized protein LOC126772025 [Nymphalis io]|uniref:uncharacterized protein LOC126772025 n=1 Tax=Inachis io TaxID=171585 RepID=UPI00216AA945|nr:uncharacterized protein LOC126772025 [Nymphalis io]